MLTVENNELFAGVGPGTPMGELLRRYWMPIGAVSEFPESGVKAMRLLGEDLVLYRDLSGNFGLVDRHCPHRRADLSYGFVEACGIRCNYHGWRFDETGRCLEQPFEDVATDGHYKDKVRITSYPVETKAGLIWAYFGPAPAPLVPTWEPFTWKNGFVQIVISEVPCNWFQCQENSIDPVHFEWMHRNWSTRLKGETGPYASRHVKLGFDEFDYGFVYRRVLEDTDESNEWWTVGRVCLWPNALFTTNHFEWRVPIDDERTLSITWYFSRVPKENEPYEQGPIPHWFGPVKDALTGRWITSHVMNQDFVAWLGQGVIADRTQEHLGTSDRGVIMMRKRFLDDLQAVARGDDPKAIVRDPQQNESLTLPIAERDFYQNGLTREQMAGKTHYKIQRSLAEFGYNLQAGQPPEIRAAHDEAMRVRVS